jgi:hypothetical protein
VRRLLGAVGAVLVVSGCGVSAEDVPTLIEESTQERAPATPSFDTITSPTPTTSSSVPPHLSPTG